MLELKQCPCITCSVSVLLLDDRTIEHPQRRPGVFAVEGKAVLETLFHELFNHKPIWDEGSLSEWQTW